MGKMEMINDFVKFLCAIKELEKCQPGYVRFYRGQPVKEPPIPAIFRKDNLLKKESEIYHEIINKKPEEFINCKCSFDFLVKMQHYGIPTRLIDITSNPLIALYFACTLSNTPQEEFAPIVYYIDIPKWLIKNYTSDSVTILSALARYDNSSKNDLSNFIATLNNVRNIYKKYILKFDYQTLEGIASGYSDTILAKCQELKDAINRAGIFLSISKENHHFFEEEHIKETFQKIITKIINNPRKGDDDVEEKIVDDALKHVLWEVNDPRLLHEIQQDKPYFKDLMRVHTFNTIYCVKPKLDNPRIMKQNGAFLIFPSKNAEWGNINYGAIDIDKGHVKNILNDLELIDISEESLFNEMDVVCSSIKKKYELC